ncbi:WD40 repeat domain-containing protein [Micromonospora sp. NPDC048170]|uniref:WD40 repeat domain-containing protein n=1 Tax=Micromonospora sp. NPDC048170 TaxID=3154819 RepID=UPI0034034C73
MLSLLFVAGALALELFANLISGPVQRLLGRLPGWLYPLALAGLLAAAAVATFWYERSGRHTDRPPGRAAGTGTGEGDPPIAGVRTGDRPAAQTRPAWRPDRRTLVRAGLGVAAAGVAVAAVPKLITRRAGPDPSAGPNGWTQRILKPPAKKKSDPVKLVFSPDGATLATGIQNSGVVMLWDLTSLARVILDSPAGAAAVAFSPDGAMVATMPVNTGCFDRGPVLIWDIATQRKVASLAGNMLGGSIAFGPDGKVLACGYHSDCDDDLTAGPGVVELWDVPRRRRTGRLTHPAMVARCATFSPDGTILAVGGGPRKPTGADSIMLWNPGTRRHLATLTHPDMTVLEVAFSPTGTALAGAGYGAGEAGVVMLWDPATRRNTATLTLPDALVESVAFSPDGRTLAAALATRSGHDGAVVLWDIATGSRVATLVHTGDPAVTSVAFSPDGRTLASGTSDASVRLWTKPAAQ